MEQISGSIATQNLTASNTDFDAALEPSNINKADSVLHVLLNPNDRLAQHPALCLAGIAIIVCTAQGIIEWIL